jgi:hypothetical protein
MRDPARIDTTLNEVRKAWIKNSDLRLIQLLEAALYPIRDTFYVEEPELNKALQKFRGNE